MWDWVSSDQHHGHKKIIEYENRQFDSLDEMDKILIQKWNSKVQKHHKCLILGDFSFYGKEKTQEILNSMNGIIGLVLGNHDRRKTYKWWIDVGFSKVYDYPIIDNGIVFSHEPIVINGYKNVHGHVHSKFYNVGVDVNNYSPVALIDYLQKIN